VKRYFWLPIDVKLCVVCRVQSSLLVCSPMRMLDVKSFVYGTDSASYRGLTAPSKAAVCLTLLLSAGMVAASPEMDVARLSSLFTVEGSWPLPLDMSLIHQNAALTSMLERISFEWEMSSLPMSFQQLEEQIISSVTSLQQHQIQDNLATLSTQLQELTVQAATQIDIVQEIVTSNVVAFQDTAGDFVNRCTELATERTSAWQLEGQVMMDDLQRATQQFSSEMQVQFASLDKLSRNTMGQVASANTRLQNEGSQLWAQYAGISMEKYRDAEQSCLSLTDKFQDQLMVGSEQLRSREQEITNQGLTYVVKKWAEAESGIHQFSERTQRSLSDVSQQAQKEMDTLSLQGQAILEHQFVDVLQNLMNAAKIQYAQTTESIHLMVRRYVEDSITKGSDSNMNYDFAPFIQEAQRSFPSALTSSSSKEIHAIADITTKFPHQ
jgi:hypothetical protein